MLCLFEGILILMAVNALGRDAAAEPATANQGIVYTNHFVEEIPWSVHIVRVTRTNPIYEIHSVHASGGALGLSPLSEQAASMNSPGRTALAGVNGDFYQRDGAFAGHPRGLQVVNGEVISAPNGGPTFWIDASGEPHLANLNALFQVIWPDGTATPFGLNGRRSSDEVELYTPAVGASTRSGGGREFILEPLEGSEWLPLRPSRTYTARVREVREGGGSRLRPDSMVLSVGPEIARRFSSLQPGAVVKMFTGTTPSLRGAKTAISGGPVLVRNGKRERISSGGSSSYESYSRFDRHPRSAIGWNQHYFFLVEVDGRQHDLSVGMTLAELSEYMVRLGCEYAMNMDGGGSATLWYAGEVRNSPCERYERSIANSVVIVRKNAPATASRPAESGSGLGK